MEGKSVPARGRLASRLMIVFTLLLTAVSGCSGKRVEEMRKHKLFVLPVGNGLEEIGVVRGQSRDFTGPSTVLFKNGFFYVVDLVNQKILKVTTPGDIILVISKGAQQDGNEDENVLRLKERRYYPFNSIGQITVDSENNLYVEDKLLQKGPEKKEIDVFGSEGGNVANDGEMYVSYILKFDRLGKYLCKIGKGGMDSEPFGFIYRMDVDNDGNLVVLTGEEEWDRWTYYKISAEGILLFYSVISSDQIFSVKEMVDVQFFILDVLPVRNSNSLIFWVSLYDTSGDTKSLDREEAIWSEEIEIKNEESLKNLSGKKEKEYKRDLLYYKLLYYNLEKQTMDKSYRWENRVEGQFMPTEELFGIDGKSNGFLWRYVDATKAIVTIFRPNGTQVARRSFVFEGTGIWTGVQVAEDGSVTGVRIDDRLLNFYRWNTDDLINRKPRKASLKELIKGAIEEFRNANR